MLRGSILYSVETYYNLKEDEIRTIEKIEESYMRNLLETKNGCNLALLYIELGHQPARFQIYKMQILYLHHILNQNETSLLLQFVKTQQKYPVKGDWFSQVMSAVKLLEITLSLEEIQVLKKDKLKKILKTQIEKKSIDYLQKKHGSKGKEIILKKNRSSRILKS